MLSQYSRQWCYKPPAGTLVDWGYPTTKGLYAAWFLTEGHGPTLFDSGLSGSDGIIQGSSAVWSVSDLGYDYLYASSSGMNYIEFSNNLFDFERTDLLTVDIWTFVPTLSTQINACGNYASTSNKGIAITLNESVNGTVTLNLKSSASNKIVVRTTNTVLAANAWHHIVVTYNGSSTASGCQIFVNGINQPITQVTDNLSSTIKTGSNWCIGRSGAASGTGSQQNSRYAMHRMWKRVLTNDEVRSLYVFPFCMQLASRNLGFVNGVGGIKNSATAIANAHILTPQWRRARRATLAITQVHTGALQQRRKRKSQLSVTQNHVWSSLASRYKRALFSITQINLWTSASKRKRRRIAALSHTHVFTNVAHPLRRRNTAWAQVQVFSAQCRRMRRVQTSLTQPNILWGLASRVRYAVLSIIHRNVLTLLGKRFRLAAIAVLQNHQLSALRRRKRRVAINTTNIHIFSLSYHRLRKAGGRFIHNNALSITLHIKRYAAIKMQQLHSFISGAFVSFAKLFDVEILLKLPGKTTYRPTVSALYRVSKLSLYKQPQGALYVSNHITTIKKGPSR